MRMDEANVSGVQENFFNRKEQLSGALLRAARAVVIDGVAIVEGRTKAKIRVQVQVEAVAVAVAYSHELARLRSGINGALGYWITRT